MQPSARHRLFIEAYLAVCSAAALGQRAKNSIQTVVVTGEKLVQSLGEMPMSLNTTSVEELLSTGTIAERFANPHARLPARIRGTIYRLTNTSTACGVAVRARI